MGGAGDGTPCKPETPPTRQQANDARQRAQDYLKAEKGSTVIAKRAIAKRFIADRPVKPPSK